MPQPDYENDLVFPPKSADDLNKQERHSDVLIAAVDKCEKLEKEVKQLKELLKECKEYLSDVDTYCTKNADESYLLITRIKTVIGESEE